MPRPFKEVRQLDALLRWLQPERSYRVNVNWPHSFAIYTSSPPAGHDGGKLERHCVVIPGRKDRSAMQTMVRAFRLRPGPAMYAKQFSPDGLFYQLTGRKLLRMLRTAQLSSTFTSA